MVIRKLSFVFLAMAILSGCAGLGTGGGTPEEIVRERAQAWADALVRGDIKTAYTYTSPGYRQFADWGRYYARMGGAARWELAEVRDVECLEKACEVTFILEYTLDKVGAEVRRPRTYKWVESEGEWWAYVPPS